VPAGTHRIELRYDMDALWVGAALSAITLLMWLGVNVRLLRVVVGSLLSF
jgi:hypothetical protein